MHAVHFDPRRILIVTVAAFVLTVIVVAWLPSALDSVSFSGATATTVTASPPPSSPVWMTDPLASPLRTLTTP